MRTFRREGELWGETSDGGLVRWDGRESRWDFDAYEASSSVDPPKMEVPAPDPNVFAVPHFGAEPNGNGSPNTASSAPASITELPPYARGDIHDREHPINKWWNRKFPPLSWKRWAFFIAVLPVMGILVQLYRYLAYGEDLSVGRYLFAVMAGWGVLTVVFVFGRRRLQGLKPRTLSNHLLDLGISVVILFLGFAVVDAVMTNELNLVSILASLGLAAFVAVVIHVRLYGLAVAAVIAAGGAVVAFFLHLFSLFLGGGDSFFRTWLLISGLGVLCAIPFTIHLHRQTRSLDGIPTYAISTLIAGSLMFLVVFMALFTP
ncbi:MAG: hypothetical protein ACRD1T_06500, partial [Acidimicrobiia bacterium]